MPSNRIILLSILVIVSLIFGAQRYSRWKAENYYKTVEGLADIASTLSKIRLDENGNLYLWANGDPGTESAEWFDITGAPLNPERYEHGIGKDAIPAIDDPQFVSADDPKLEDHGITDESNIIGYSHKGQAKAYPIQILNRHELVNDRVGGKPVTVGW